MIWLKRAGKVLSSLLTVLLVLLLCFNVYSMVARMAFQEIQPTLFGWSNAVVITGSMADTIMVNDMIVIHQQEDYALGDIITYRSGNILITHRIVAVTETGFITRGDANNTDDGEISRDAVVGKVVLIIPLVGYVIEWLQTPLGMLLMLGSLFALLMWPQIAEWLKGEPEEE